MESKIVINDVPLSGAQVMTIKVSCGSFQFDLEEFGLGEDESGKSMAEAYKARLAEIFKIMNTK